MTSLPITALPSVLLGVPIDSLTMGTCVERIGALVADGRATGRTHQVATVNTDFLVNAAEEPALLDLLQSSALNLADGMPLVWVSPRIGPRLPERIAGSDLVPRLAMESAARGWSVHFYGGEQSVVTRAEKMLKQRYPTAQLTFDAGTMIRDVSAVDSSIIDGIRAIDPDILCVALGNPKQERFIAAQAEHLGCPVAIGIGGSLDMLVGERRRAPRWVQRIGAEWIVRALQEPARLGPRYARDVRVFLPRLWSYVRTVRRFRDGADIAVREGTRRQVEVVPRGTGSIERLPSLSARLPDSEALDVDMNGASSLNPTAHAALIALIRAARLRQVPVNVAGVSTSMESCLSQYGTTALLKPVSSSGSKSSDARAEAPVGCGA
jgi:exopolysaccharide biosynthesis WecB/TagA/CpsF family protein